MSRILQSPLKTVRLAALASVLALSTSCEDFLDVNTNPNAPQDVSANLYLAPMLHWLVSSPQFDGRFIGKYTQEWYAVSTSLTTWDRMGYDPSSDNGAQQWRDVYWSLGQNLVDMMTKAEAEERWDLLGVGNILKAWGWLVLTDMHGEIIVKEAINQNTFSFNYDTQEYAYQEVFRLVDSAIVLLQKTDGAVDVGYMARGDKIYNGDRTKWLKFAYGLKAIALNHFSNKSTYKPADVIAAVNLSFASNADDALLTYPNTNNDDINFWGRTRGNMTATASASNGPFRQTQFAVNLMNGTVFGGVVDPRMSRMLSPSPDGQFRGMDINVVGFGAMTAAQQPNNFHGFVGTGGVGVPGRFLFDDKAKIPVMTYAQLQFVKAEAALRMGDQATALTAYRNGISSHIDWVNARNLDNNQQPTQITASEKSAFLASTAIVPATLTLSHIMSQKWIAQFGWGHNEMWMDMRRYHYTDMDPVSGTQVFRGFTPPTTLHADNAGKLVYRIRPRFNSEYVWNRPGLDVIGGLATDYHTKPTWIITP
jgi:hypothetical protein